LACLILRVIKHNTNTDTAVCGKANCKHSHTSFSFLHFPFSFQHKHPYKLDAGCWLLILLLLLGVYADHYHDARCMMDVDGGDGDDGGNTAGSFELRASLFLGDCDWKNFK
jgi:hypothetical protein